MNISAITPLAEPVRPVSLGKALVRADQSFQSLSAALNSGNAASAKNSLADLKKLLQSAGAIGEANSVKNDFDAIGRDLGSSDLKAAHKDVQQLRTDVQSVAQRSISGLLGIVPGGSLVQNALGASQVGAKRIGSLIP